MSSGHEHNRRAWDALVAENGRHTRPAKDRDFENPLAALDARGWLGGNVRGRRVLCLAAGGGRQSALFAAAGAIVTVVDNSPAMLELDREVAAQRRLDVRIVQASMDDLSMLPAAGFDIVSQPVSTCYVEDVALVYRQVARVAAAGGVYISQHKQPASLQASVRPVDGGYQLSEPYYRSGPLPAVHDSLHREPGTLEYLHRLEQLVGDLCRAGFVIEDFSEPLHTKAGAAPDSFAHRARYLPPYVAIKARRVSQTGPGESKQRGLWTP